MKKKKEHKKKDRKESYKRKITSVIYVIISLIVATGFFVYSKSLLASFSALIITFGLLMGFMITKIKLDQTTRIKKMESAFPDFLGLMSSNLRAGMTIDKALLLSSRKEFAPLDKEINSLGKDIVTGKSIEDALDSMSEKIKSEKIEKTIKLITSGIKSGGNLAVLLEETSINLREKDFVEKRAASNVLMYAIFIFFAITIGAPILFGLSSVLIEVLTQILSTIPDVETGSNLPFTLSKINISVSFITYFTLIFLITTDILGAMVLGLVSKGNEREGLKFLIPLVVLSVSVFFVVKIVLGKFLFGAIG